MLNDHSDLPIILLSTTMIAPFMVNEKAFLEDQAKVIGLQILPLVNPPAVDSCFVVTEYSESHYRGETITFAIHLVITKLFTSFLCYSRVRNPGNQSLETSL